MGDSLRHTTEDRHRERLEIGRPQMAKADLKKVDICWKASVGQVFQRCLLLAGVSQKEAAALLQRDPGQVGRWIAGTERTQLDAVLAVEQFRQPFVQALAEVAGAEVEITVKLRRLA